MSAQSAPLRHPPPFKPTAPCPGRVWSVEALQGGVVLSSTTPLPLSITTFGRDEDSVTIPLTDPSASRVHAAVAYDSSGRLNACDMSSANGSHLSGKKLIGGQWVVLMDGASLRFGTSGVSYTFMAPPGWEAEKPAVTQPSSNHSAVLSGEAAEATLEREAGEEGRSMGMVRLGAPLKSSSSSSPWLEALALQQCNDKEREAIGRLQQKQQRLSHARQEASRIQAKEGGGLSDGQQAQLAKLETTIETLQDTLVEEESAIRTRLEARRPGCTGLPPPTTTASGTTVGVRERERELDPSWLRDSDDVVDKTRGGASLAAPKPRPAFSIRTGGGGSGSLGGGLKVVVAAPPPRLAHPLSSSTTFTTTTQAPLQTEASLTARISLIDQRLEAIIQERGKWKAGKGDVEGGEDSLATYVSALKESEGVRVAKEEVELKGERESLLTLLAIIQPSFSMQPASASSSSSSSSGSGGGSGGGGGVKHSREEESKVEERKGVAPVMVRCGGLGEVVLEERVEGGVSGSMASILELPPPPAKKQRSAPLPQPPTTTFQQCDQYDAEPEDLTRFT